MTSIIERKENYGRVSIVKYFPSLLDNDEEKNIFEWLENMDDFKGGTLYYKREIPRLQKWYQIDGKYFSKGWRKRHDRWESHVYDNKLFDIQNKMQNFIHNKTEMEPVFNSCLINLYRNGEDSIRLHSDSLDSFGDEPVILVISIGQPRDIVFHRKIVSDNSRSLKLDENEEPIHIRMESGSVLMMSGSTQIYYCHEVPKCECENKRYSLTFREFIQ